MLESGRLHGEGLVGCCDLAGTGLGGNRGGIRCRGVGIVGAYSCAFRFCSAESFDNWRRTGAGHGWFVM